MENQISKLVTSLKQLNGGKLWQTVMSFGGNHNKALRQAIMNEITGIKNPVSKCGVHNILSALNWNQMYN